MTLIAAWRSNGQTTVCADLNVSDGTLLYPTKQKLWRPLPGLVIGVAGDQSAIPLIRNGAFPTAQTADGLSPEWVVSEVLEPAFDEPGDNIDFSMLLATKDEIYLADNHFSVFKVEDPFVAIGSAANFTYGYWVRHSQSEVLVEWSWSALFSAASEYVSHISADFVEEVLK